MVLDYLIKGGEYILDKISKNFEKAGNVDGLTEKNLRAFIENRGVSDLLLYRYYEEDEDGIGIYTMADGRKGFILKFNAPIFITDETEMKFISIFEGFMVNGTVLHFSTFASQNISKEVEDFINNHPVEVNISNREILKELIQKRAEYLKKWTRESIFKGINFKIRNYINTLSVSYPKGTDIETIKMEYESVKESLKEYGVQNFDAGQLVTMLREFFHNEKESEYWNANYDEMKALNSQIISGGVEIDLSKKKWKKGYVVNNENYVTTLVTKEFPNSISAEEFTNLFYDKYGNEINLPVTGGFITTLTIVLEDIEKLKEQTLSKLNHDYGEIRKFDLRTIEKNPEMKERLDEVKSQIKFIRLHNEYPMKAMWTLTLFDKDKKGIQHSISSIKEKFRKKGWLLIEEKFVNIALFETLFSLPLQYSKTVEEFLKRFDLLFKSNSASIIPLIGDFKGFGYAHIPYIGRSGQIEWFDPYAPGTENYNVAAVGSSGSGKSFTFNDFMAMSLAKNAKIRVIDSLPSYKRFTNLVGGQYVDFKDSQKVCLNFFTNILTKRDEKTGEEILVKGEKGKYYPVIAEEEMATIIPLIAMMARLDRVVVSNSSEISSVNDSADASFLAAMFEEAVNVAFRSKGNSAGMYDVRKYLVEKMHQYKSEGYNHQAELLLSVTEGLKPFSDPDGNYYHYFNGVNNFNLDKDLMVVELSSLEQKGIIYPVVMMALANMIVNEFFGDDTRQKILIIDEFWKFKDNLIVGAFTEELARKVRKMRGSLVTITQTNEDYKGNPRMKALYHNSSWKFAIGRNYMETGLGFFADNLLKTVAPRFPYFGENAVFTSSSMSINRLKTDPLCYYLFATDDAAKAEINETVKRYEISELEAVKFLARKMEKPELADTDILKEIGVLDEDEFSKLEREKKKRKEKIKKKIEEAIEFSEINLKLIPIANKEKKVIGYEVLSYLGREFNNIPFNELKEVLEEEQKIVEFDMLIVRRAIQYFSLQTDYIFSVNMELETFKNKKALLQIIDLVKELKVENRIYIEVPLKDIEKEEFSLVNENIKMLKDYGIKISNDKIDLEVSYGKLMQFEIDMLKIDRNIVKRISNDKEIKNFLEMISFLSDKAEIEVCFVNIEDEETFFECVEVGGELFEGFLFEKPSII